MLPGAAESAHLSGKRGIHSGKHLRYCTHVPRTDSYKSAAEAFLKWLRNEDGELKDAWGPGLGLKNINIYQASSGPWVFFDTLPSEVAQAATTVREASRAVVGAITDRNVNYFLYWVADPKGDVVDRSDRTRRFLRRRSITLSYSEQALINKHLGDVFPQAKIFEEWQKRWKVESDRSITLSREDIPSQYEGNWKQLRVKTYISWSATEWYTSEVDTIMKSVARFYARYGIKVTWQTTKIVGLAHYFDPEYRKRADSEQPWDTYLRKIRFDGPPVENDEPDLNPKQLEWYMTAFRHVPSVFFINDISVKGELSLLGTPDAPGVTRDRMFVFVPSTIAWYFPPYDYVVAHELGHVLGLDHEKNTLMQAESGSLIPGLGEQLKDATLTDTQVIKMRKSSWLQSIPDPQPGR